MSCCAILVNYHGAADTAAAAWSVLADESSSELIVVDNSTDASELARLKQLLPKAARLVAAPQNIGFGQACNLAFNASVADYVFLVNPDVRIVSGCLQALLIEMQRDERLGAVAPRQYLDDACQWGLPPSWFPTALRAWATDLAMRDRNSAKRLSRALRAESLRYWTTEQSTTQRALSGGVMLIRRSALDPGDQLFDPRFFMYFEDSDLCHRLKRSGHRLGMVPKASAVHRWRNQPHKAALMAKGASVYFSKYGGGANPWRDKASRLLNRMVLHPLLGDPKVFPRSGLVVPTSWELGWLLELSPSPLISPAIGLLGDGATVAFPGEVLANFEGAPVYARLGPAVPSRATDNCWYFEFNRGTESVNVCDH